MSAVAAHDLYFAPKYDATWLNTIQKENVAQRVFALGYYANAPSEYCRIDEIPSMKCVKL